MSASSQVEKWGVYELALPGPSEGNPFTEVTFGARFRYQHREVLADGFYDGEGIYRVRFMPDAEGEWRCETVSNIAALNGAQAAFTCVAPGAGNHGPVRVRRRYHFAYEDGSPYWQVGTTCYAWAHQGDALEEQTLRTLAQAPFNKMRMCVFPKDYSYNKNEPVYYAYERQADGSWDFTRFNPAFWRHFEQRVGQLRDLGIEADLILFHPYDRWGFSDMGAAADDLYLRYIVARLAAYRNVWWSLANEYDLMKSKEMCDWDRFFRIIQQCDPYQHLRSVHNCHGFYDHTKPWVTHQSIQHSEVERTEVWRDLYNKPVVIDECKYEGNIIQRWGNISAEELTRRFWEATVRGGYCGHGETYYHSEDILWWAKGGVLHGQSPARIAFLRRILEESPAEGLDPIKGIVEQGYPCAGQPGKYLLTYTGQSQTALLVFNLPAGEKYRAEIIDTWAMTTEPLPWLLEGRAEVKLPSRQFMAVRLKRA